MTDRTAVSISAREVEPNADSLHTNDLGSNNSSTHNSGENTSGAIRLSANKSSADKSNENNLNANNSGATTPDIFGTNARDEMVPPAFAPAAVAFAPAAIALTPAAVALTSAAVALASAAPTVVATEATATAAVVRPPAVVLDESDSDSYAALHNGAAFFDLAPRHISAFTGEKAAEALNGLVSNDVMPLAVGKGLYAVALTPKGKMLADVSILRTEPQTYLVETSESAGREWWSMVRKYVNPRLAKYSDLTAAHSTIGVYGPNAPAIIARLGTGGLGDQALTDAMQEGLRSWPSWAHSSFTISGVNVRLVRAPYLGSLLGFEILVPVASRNDVIKNLVRVGAVAASERLWQLAQIEGALPVYGLDMDANTIPQEANLDHWAAISYEKGCYTGQETVARIHFRGHVNKHLRGLSSSALLQPGSPIHDANGKAIGEVRRSGLSPRLGPIAIGMIRREIAEGSDVLVGSFGGVQVAQVTALPFAAENWGTNAKQGAS